MKIAGSEVVDAKKSIILKINNDDVKAAGKKDPAACAAALACIRQMSAPAALVHLGRTYVKIKNKWVRYLTPDALRSEIIAFDRGGKFAPGEYLLRVVQPSHQGYGYRQGGPTDKRGEKGISRPHRIVPDVRYSMRPESKKS